MNDKWIAHVEGEVPPAGSRGHKCLEILNKDDTVQTVVAPYMLHWPSIKAWRPHRVPDTAMDLSPPLQTLFSIQAVINTRSKTHGDYKTQAALAQALKDRMRDSPNWGTLFPNQAETLEMVAHKISRILVGNPNEPDHWRDIAGYATLVENILVHGKSHLK